MQLAHLVTSLQKLAHISRPQIALQAALYTWLGAYLASGHPVSHPDRVALAATVVAVIVAFGFVINDLADLDLDSTTKPYRPLPAGRLTPLEARLIAQLLALLATILALGLPPLLLLIALGNLLLTTVYSLLLKRTVLLGNVAIALLNSSILVFGALAAGELPSIVWTVAAMSFLYTVAQEVLYTVDDVEGDQAAGLVTAPVYFGVGPSLFLAAVLLGLAMLAALAPFLLEVASIGYLLVLLICTIVPVMLYILPLILRASAESITRACAAVKIVRVTSLLPLFLLPVN